MNTQPTLFALNFGSRRKLAPLFGRPTGSAGAICRRSALFSACWFLQIRRSAVALTLQLSSLPACSLQPAACCTQPASLSACDLTSQASKCAPMSSAMSSASEFQFRSLRRIVSSRKSFLPRLCLLRNSASEHAQAPARRVRRKQGRKCSDLN